MRYLTSTIECQHLFTYQKGFLRRSAVQWDTKDVKGVVLESRILFSSLKINSFPPKENSSSILLPKLYARTSDIVLNVVSTQFDKPKV